MNALPNPQNEYNIEVPEIEEKPEAEPEIQNIPEDREEAEAREEAHRRAKEEEEAAKMYAEIKITIDHCRLKENCHGHLWRKEVRRQPRPRRI